MFPTAPTSVRESPGWHPSPVGLPQRPSVARRPKRSGADRFSTATFKIPQDMPHEGSVPSPGTLIVQWMPWASPPVSPGLPEARTAAPGSRSTPGPRRGPWSLWAETPSLAPRGQIQSPEPGGRPSACSTHRQGGSAQLILPGPCSRSRLCSGRGPPETCPFVSQIGAVQRDEPGCRGGPHVPPDRAWWPPWPRAQRRAQFDYGGHDWDAQHEYPDVSQVHPGETVRASLTFLSPAQHVGKFRPGLPFLIREGQRVVGYGCVRRILDLENSAAAGRTEPGGGGAG